MNNTMDALAKMVGDRLLKIYNHEVVEFLKFMGPIECKMAEFQVEHNRDSCSPVRISFRGALIITLQIKMIENNTQLDVKVLRLYKEVSSESI